MDAAAPLPAALDGYERFIGKATAKGLVLKALHRNGTTVASYFIAVRAQEFVGPLKRLGTFEVVADPEEERIVMFFARRSFNTMKAGDLAQWD